MDEELLKIVSFDALKVFRAMVGIEIVFWTPVKGAPEKNLVTIPTADELIHLILPDSLH
jgi:hypothetical protein